MSIKSFCASAGGILVLSATMAAQGSTISQFLFDTPPIDGPAAGTQYLVVNSVTGGDQPAMLSPSSTTHANLQVTATGPFGKQTGVFQAPSTGLGVAFTTASTFNWSSLPEWTLEMWINPASTTAAMDPINYHGIVIRSDSSDRLQMLIPNSNGVGWIASAVGDAVLTDNEWTHVAVVFDGPSDQVRMYVDASLYVTMAYTSATTANTVSGNLAIGNFSTNANQFRGMIDEIRVTDDALLPSQLGFHGTLVPEPAAAAVFGLGAMGLVARRRRHG